MKMSKEDAKLAKEIWNEYENLSQQRSDAYKTVHDLDIKISINQNKLDELLKKYEIIKHQN